MFYTQLAKGKMSAYLKSNAQTLHLLQQYMPGKMPEDMLRVRIPVQNIPVIENHKLVLYYLLVQNDMLQVMGDLQSQSYNSTSGIMTWEPLNHEMLFEQAQSSKYAEHMQSLPADSVGIQRGVLGTWSDDAPKRPVGRPRISVEEKQVPEMPLSFNPTFTVNRQSRSLQSYTDCYRLLNDRRARLSAYVGYRTKGEVEGVSFLFEGENADQWNADEPAPAILIARYLHIRGIPLKATEGKSARHTAKVSAARESSAKYAADSNIVNPITGELVFKYGLEGQKVQTMLKVQAAEQAGAPLPTTVAEFVAWFRLYNSYASMYANATSQSELYNSIVFTKTDDRIKKLLEWVQENLVGIREWRTRIEGVKQDAEPAPVAPVEQAIVTGVYLGLDLTNVRAAQAEDSTPAHHPEQSYNIPEDPTPNPYEERVEPPVVPRGTETMLYYNPASSLDLPPED